ncbi:14263_t:CDS:2, partial [Entrophospora sp. SA101]
TLRDQGAGDNTHQEFLDNLISQLTEEANASAKGPPPASKSFINKLPIVPKSDINSVDSDDPIWRQKQKDLKNQQIRQEDDEEDVDPIDFMYL